MKILIVSIYMSLPKINKKNYNALHGPETSNHFPEA